MRRRWIYVSASCLAVGFCFGMLVDTPKQLYASNMAQAPAVNVPAAQKSTAFFDFSDLAEAVQPAVVNISTTKLVSSRAPSVLDWNQIPPQFRDFFRFFGPIPESQPENSFPKKKKLNSLGSGVIVAAEGFVVTNYHVIKDADEIQVVMGDERALAAVIVGTDEKTDVALLKIQADGSYPYLEFGDSDELKVGEWVLAVGNPFGLSHTFTAGIVSAKGRQIGNDIPYQDFIQTDASINPGNSGGPLLNLRGQLIGVNTAIFSRTGQSAGIGFAIPSNLAKFVVDQLRAKQRVDRGYLGVLIQSIDEQIASSLGLQEPRGAMVTKVLPDGPAGKAGIKTGDLILEFNGEKIKNSSDLPLKVSTTPPGGKGKLKILRGGKYLEIVVALGELPQTEIANRAPSSAPTPAQDFTSLGMTLRTLSSDELRKNGLENGLLVLNVNANSPGIDAAIQPGDILIKADDIWLKSVLDFDVAVKNAQKNKKKALLVLVNRDDRNRFTGIALD